MVNISHTPTISSLAFRIFRTNFLDQNNNIAVLSGHVYDFIYQGYYGGAVDAYIPFGENIKGYDVNSLYPTSMKNNTMPVGNPYYFEGNILNYFSKVNFNYPPDNHLKTTTIFDYLNKNFELKNKDTFNANFIEILNLNSNNNSINKGSLSNKDNLPFGFFEVEIETPSKFEVNNPILLKKHKNNLGVSRTIAPVGKWKGIYFSEELYNALNKNKNYKFKVLRGFLFRQGNLFEGYVDILFNLRISNPKNSPLNLIAKLLLNSLYGRFGMNPDKPNHLFINENKSNNIDSIYKYNDVLNVLDLGNGKELLTYMPKKNLTLDYEDDSSNCDLQINVAIAASITGYSRIFMSYFKDNPLFKLYYSDTDSAFLDINLDKYEPNLIGKELGKLKLEYEFITALFLAPKVYGGMTQGGESVVKAKGVKNIIPFSSLKSLLNKDFNLQIPSEK
jgi:hypothetical protein